MTTACGAAGPPLDQLAYPEPGFPSLQPAVVVWELPRSSSTSWAGRRSGGRGTILSRGAFWVAKQPVVRDYDLGQAARDRATGGRKDKPRHSLLPPESATLLWAAVSGRGGGQPTSPRSFLLCLLAAVGILFLWGVPAGRNASKRRHNPGAGMGAVIQVSPLLPASGSPSREQQLRIPRIVHQTYKVAEPPYSAIEFMQSWRDINQGYDFRFYDDEACVEFVKREFPQYLDAYNGLPKDVERSDFFRYMVLLRHGGVYADIDTECRLPVDSLLKAEDTMVVGWENEWPSQAVAFDHHYVRRRQVLQWVIMAAPGHPVLREVCDFIASNSRQTFSNNTNRDTLERTGPGVWTDIVLRHSVRPDPAWPIRILPRVAFGVNPKDLADAVRPDHSDIAVLHHFLGSWKVQGGWKKQQSIAETATSFIASFATRKMVAAGAEVEEAVKDSGTDMFPVSALFDPPFTVFVRLVGQGRSPAGQDVSSELTVWGGYQPGIAPTRQPRVVDALAGVLSSQRAAGGSFLDIGAGLGYFSLAAAARGHSVHAFELGPENLELLRHGVKVNGFQNLVDVHEAALGGPEEEKICISRTGASEALQANLISGGYASTATHAVEDGLGEAGDCTATAMRRPLGPLLSTEQNVSIGVVRIGANGWEGWILDGMGDIIEEHPPAAILLEFHPSAIPATNYPGTPVSILHKLYALGYTEISHSGTVCDERWHNITGSIRLRGSYLWSSDAQEALKQPTWCKLDPTKFETLSERAHSVMPENVLFTFMGHPDKQDVNVAQQKDDPQPVMAGSAAAGGYETQQQDDLVLAAPDVSVLGTVGVADG